MNLPPDYALIASSRGVPLSTMNPGSEEVGLPRGSAVEALNCLGGSSIAVVGGDVLKVTEGRLEYAYANWYCNRQEGEPARQYADRSQKLALEYINKFVAVGGYEPLFVLVLTE